MLLHDYLRRSAQTAPEKVALVCGASRSTYAELAATASSVAGYLCAHGLGKGDRVAIYIDSSPEAVIAVFGVLQAGGCIVVVNPATQADRLGYILENCGAKFLVSSVEKKALVAKAAAACARPPGIIWTGKGEEDESGEPAGTVRDRLARLVYDRTPLDDRRSARADGRVRLRLRLASAAAEPRRAAPTDGPVVVKSVQSILALDWVWERFRPRVLVVERNPLNVLASWIELGYVRNARERDAIAAFASRRWGIAPPEPGSPQLVHQAFTYATLATELREAAGRHPEWTVVRHEELCVEPSKSFRALAERVGLVFGPAAEQFLGESDAEGTPYRTLRRPAEQPERWRERLDAEQVATIRDVLSRFPGALVPDA